MEPLQHNTTEIKELDQRRGDALLVTLYWLKGTLETYVEVTDYKRESTTIIPTPEGVPPHEVYNHPFRYVKRPDQ